MSTHVMYDIQVRRSLHKNSSFRTHLANVTGYDVMMTVVQELLSWGTPKRNIRIIRREYQLNKEETMLCK